MHLIGYAIEPQGNDDGKACVLNFTDGNKRTLAFGESMQVLTDGEVNLECLGEKPTRCSVSVWQDPPE
jgi:hypothetical protein